MHCRYQYFPSPVPTSPSPFQQLNPSVTTVSPDRGKGNTKKRVQEGKKLHERRRDRFGAVFATLDGYVGLA